MKFGFMSRKVGNINNASHPQNSATTFVELGQKLVTFRILYRTVYAEQTGDGKWFKIYFFIKYLLIKCRRW